MLVSDNSSLKNLTGLQNLTRVSGALAISNNPVLIDMTGLEQLQTARNLYINKGKALTSLAGLSELDSGSKQP